jgi:predicted transposase YbfD/YdcC
MVSAWACVNNLVLGQIKTTEKSNEITAIPELLDILNISGNTITIDAMGTQKEIVKKIINQDADYILAVKANQPQLLENIEDEFKFYKPLELETAYDLGHGRIETRTCSVITDFQFIEPINEWKNLSAIIKIESIREFKNSNKATEKATRYYISSLQNNANQFQSKIRSHWTVENKLHWTLDVAFSEDASRKRAGNAAQNYSILFKTALNLLKNEHLKKLSIKSKRLETGWNEDYLLKILNLKV